jgi:methyl-accepting chemotaxis protein
MRKLLYSIIDTSFRLAAALGIFFNLAGIILVWRYVPIVTERAIATATFAQKALDSTDALLTVAEQSLTQAEESITLISDATQEMATSLETTASIATSVSEMVGDEFIGVVENTQTALTSLENSAKLVDDTLSLIAAIPFLGSKYSNQTPLYNSVVGVNQSLSELPNTMLSLQDSLDSTASAFSLLNGSLGTLADSVSEIESSLQEANTVVRSYQLLIKEAQNDTAVVLEKLPAWVRWTAVGLTLLLLWAILIQAGLLLYGLEIADRNSTGGVPAKQTSDNHENLPKD